MSYIRVAHFSNLQENSSEFPAQWNCRSIHVNVVFKLLSTNAVALSESLFSWNYDDYIFSSKKLNYTEGMLCSLGAESEWVREIQSNPSLAQKFIFMSKFE